MTLYHLHPQTDEALQDRSSRYLPWLGPIIWTNYSKVTSRSYEEPFLDNDVASAIALVRKRFEHEGTRQWPEVTVEWFTTYLMTEVGATPHADRQGCNAPSSTQAYQELIQDFVCETMQRHALLSQKCYAHDPSLKTRP